MGDAAWIDRVLAGKYIVEGVLGRGGMGLVLKARHLRLDELVAIKVLHASLVNDESMAARMLREARAALRLSSEHVVRVMDVDTLENGTPFMVMEYLEGTDVSSLARKRGGVLPFEQAAAIAEQTCRALAEAHALGIVHRDLKPANLFVVERPDGRRVVKLLDFGISKVNVPREAPITKKGDILGSPRYMSPEQVRGDTLDGRADLWSVGVVLYELLAGKPPFEGNNFAVTCRRVLDATPEPLAKLRPDVPPGLCAVIDRCLEKDRERRFPDALALRDALGPFGPLSARTGSISGIADLGTWSAPTSANSLVPVVGLLSVAPPASSSVPPPPSSSVAPPPSSSVPPPASSTPGAPPVASSVPPPSVTRPSAVPPAIPRAAVPPPPLSPVSGASHAPAGSSALAGSGASPALAGSGASALSVSGASPALSASGAFAALSASGASPSVEPSAAGAATPNAPPPAGSAASDDPAITAWAIAPPRRSRTFVGFAIAGLAVGVATGVVVLARETDAPAPAATAPSLTPTSAQSASSERPPPPPPSSAEAGAPSGDPAAPQPTTSAAALKDPSHSEPSLAEPAPAQAAPDVRAAPPPRNKPASVAKPAAAPVDPFGERRK